MKHVHKVRQLGASESVFRDGQLDDIFATASEAAHGFEVKRAKREEGAESGEPAFKVRRTQELYADEDDSDWGPFTRQRFCCAGTESDCSGQEVEQSDSIGVQGNKNNIKITHQGDLKIAETILN